MYDNAKLVGLLKRDALKLGEFTLASGRTSHYYVDARKVTLSSEGANAVSRGVVELIKREYPHGSQVHGIGGLTMGADPIVGATLQRLGAEMPYAYYGFLVRKEAKGHGTKQRVEGAVGPGDNVIIVDDVATTGGSALQAADAVAELGCAVVAVVVVLDRLEGAAEAFAARGIPFHSLATIRDLGVEPLSQGG